LKEKIEEAEERMQERGREYHGMLRMGCESFETTLHASPLTRQFNKKRRQKGKC
jgi:hypothetical protein